MPTKDMMDKIAAFPTFQKPSHTKTPKRDSIEYFIYITERISQNPLCSTRMLYVLWSFQEVVSSAQIRIHFTKESEGSHVKACIQVQPKITQFNRKVRDAEFKQKSSKAGALLQKEMTTLLLQTQLFSSRTDQEVEFESD